MREAGFTLALAILVVLAGLLGMRPGEKICFTESFCIERGGQPS